MGKIKKIKKFIPILLGLMVILLPFGNFKAFAAVDNGFNSPSINSYTTGSNPNNTIDSNMSTYGSVNGGSYISYNLPSYASTFRVYASDTSGMGQNFNVQFLNSSGATLGSVIYQGIPGGSPVKNYDFSIPTGTATAKVYYVSSSTWLNIYEVEYNANITHTEITNLTGTPGNNNIALSWDDLSGNSSLTGYKVYKNGALLKTLGTSTHSYNDTGLTINTSYTYKVTAIYADGFETSGATKTASTLNPPPEEVKNLTGQAQRNQVDLSWINPTDSYFSGKVNIYRDGTKIGQSTGTGFADTNVNSGTSYTYKVTTLSNTGVESTGTLLTLGTTLDDVTNAQANPSSYQVDLSWNNPNEPLFDTAHIYRNGTLIASANDGKYTDQNLSASTDYTYTIKAVSTDGTETDGVTLKTTTKAPVMVGTQYTQQPNGDVKITWQQPTTGTVNVYVAGKLYATVDASKMQELVLKKDVVTTPFGDYAMSVQPVTANGVTGEKVQAPQMGGQNLPFSASELAQSGTNLLWYISPLVLLALTFLLVPKLRKLLFDSIRRIRGKEEKEQTRRTEKELREQRERHEGKEHLEKVGLSPTKEPREEREQRERQERQQRNRELKEITEAATKEPRIRVEREEKEGRVQRISRTLREPRERVKQARDRHREPRQPRERTRQPRKPRGSRGDY